MSDLFRFPNVATAVAWADELTSRPEVGSQIGKLVRVPGGGQFTMDELRDYAHTISRIVSSTVPPIGGIALRAVHGVSKDGDADALAAELARVAIDEAPELRARFRRLELLGLAVIGAERSLAHYGRPVSKAKLAEAIGMKRQSFAINGWPDALKGMRATFDGWVEAGARYVAGALEERAMLMKYPDGVRLGTDGAKRRQSVVMF